MSGRRIREYEQPGLFVPQSGNVPTPINNAINSANNMTVTRFSLLLRPAVGDLQNLIVTAHRVTAICQEGSRFGQF